MLGNPPQVDCVGEKFDPLHDVPEPTLVANAGKPPTTRIHRETEGDACVVDEVRPSLCAYSSRVPLAIMTSALSSSHTYCSRSLANTTTSCHLAVPWGPLTASL